MLSSSRMRLDIVTAVRCISILFGVAIVYYSNPDLFLAKGLVFAAMVFDAVAMVSTINSAQLESFDNLLLSTPSLQFVPVYLFFFDTDLSDRRYLEWSSSHRRGRTASNVPIFDFETLCPPLHQCYRYVSDVHHGVLSCTTPLLKC